MNAKRNVIIFRAMGRWYETKISVSMIKPMATGAAPTLHGRPEWW